MISTGRKDKWEIDVPVAINFFARPNTLKSVFDVIRSVKPKQLFLIADGPRENVPSDQINCKECRNIVEDIDWECEVYKFYNESNKGLWATYFDSMKQVFELVDRCIFMEDDVVVSNSFFYYCRDLLEKYKDDLRVSFITAINFEGISTRIESDYFFCGEGSLTAYGLWKRTFELMNLSYCDDRYAVKAMSQVAKREKPGYEKRIAAYVDNPNWQGHIPHVEVYKNLLRFSENQLCIVPKKNMVTNIGVCSGASHSANSLRFLPKATQVIFEAQRYDLEFPLHHPKYVVNDLEYEKVVNNILAWNNPLLKFCRRLEALTRHLVFGDWSRVFVKIRLLISGNLKE